MTRDEIVTAGLQKAGDTNLTTLANTWFQAWLDKEYASHPWPSLQRTISGVALAGVPTPTTSLAIGAGSGGVTNRIHRILSPIWVYNAAYSVRQKALVRSILSSDAESEPTINNPSTWKGIPLLFNCRPSNVTRGLWAMEPAPPPDQAYLLKIPYWEIPAALSGSSIPIYENDRTMIQAVMTDALAHMEGPEGGGRYMQELEILGSMTVEDRVRYGTKDGINNVMPLDESMFR